MNVQSRTQKIALVGIVVVILAAIVYTLTRSGSPEIKQSAPLTPEQQRQVLDSLEPSQPSKNNPELTPEQKRALNSLGTGATTTAKQSSNTPTQEKSVLDSLQGN